MSCLPWIFRLATPVWFPAARQTQSMGPCGANRPFTVAGLGCPAARLDLSGGGEPPEHAVVGRWHGVIRALRCSTRGDQVQQGAAGWPNHQTVLGNRRSPPRAKDGPKERPL